MKKIIAMAALLAICMGGFAAKKKKAAEPGKPTERQ